MQQKTESEAKNQPKLNNSVHCAEEEHRGKHENSKEGGCAKRWSTGLRMVWAAI